MEIDLESALSWLSQGLIVVGTITLAQFGALPALIIFLVSNMTFAMYGFLSNQKSFIWLQAVLGILNTYGIWRLMS